MKRILLLIALTAICTTALHARTDSTDNDTPKVELLRVVPEPFHDFLRFEFDVHDTAQHEVKIQIINERQEVMFMEKVLIFEGHEQITVNTIDFFLPGMYSIKVKIDRRYKYVRKNKWVQ